MDILDIFGHFLLKPPQPLMGLFLVREEPEAHTHVVRSHVNAMGFTESGLDHIERDTNPPTHSTTMCRFIRHRLNFLLYCNVSIMFF